MDWTSALLAILLAYFGFGPAVRVTPGHVGARTAPAYKCPAHIQAALDLPAKYRTHLDPALFCTKR